MAASAPPKQMEMKKDGEPPKFNPVLQQFPQEMIEARDFWNQYATPTGLAQTIYLTQYETLGISNPMIGPLEENTFKDFDSSGDQELKAGYDELRLAIQADQKRDFKTALGLYLNALEILAKREDEAKNTGMPIDKDVHRRIDDYSKRTRDIQDALPLVTPALPLTPDSPLPGTDTPIQKTRYFLVRTAQTSFSNYRPNVARELLFPRGVYVQIILQIDKWCWCNFNGKRGWVSTAHLIVPEVIQANSLIRVLLFDSKHLMFWNPYPVHVLGSQSNGPTSGAQQIQVGVHSIGQREAIDCCCIRDACTCGFCLNHCCQMCIPLVGCIQRALAICCSVCHGCDKLDNGPGLCDGCCSPTCCTSCTNCDCGRGCLECVECCNDCKFQV